MVYILVACGGGIGALLRFCLVQTVAFPYGTLSVNVIGSFLMGLAFAYFAGRLGEVAPMFLMVGIYLAMGNIVLIIGLVNIHHLR